MTDKEKTEEILKRLLKLDAGNVADNFIKMPEYRLGSAYNGFSQQRIDLFAISPNNGNKTICYEIKVSRADFKNDIKKENKQIASRCFSNEFYYCTPKGLLKKEEIPVWAGLIEFDLDKPIVESRYAAEVFQTIVKPSPSFDKCLPTWGMIVSAFRKGFDLGYKESKHDNTDLTGFYTKELDPDELYRVYVKSENHYYYQTVLLRNTKDVDIIYFRKNDCFKIYKESKVNDVIVEYCLKELDKNNHLIYEGDRYEDENKNIHEIDYNKQTKQFLDINLNDDTSQIIVDPKYLREMEIIDSLYREGIDDRYRE